MTTATSNGSVNSMHDSLNPIAGLVPMSNMMLNVVFSGIGAGFLNMLMYIIVAVFLAGLMVGRTPEYLGKKVEAKEVKLAMMAMLLHPLLILAGGRSLRGDRLGGQDDGQSRARTASRRSSTSSAPRRANNGSGFEGLGDNTPAWNVATGIVLLMGRFPPILLPLALAGFLATKKLVPQTAGTLKTDNLTFFGMLRGHCLAGRCVVVHARARARTRGRSPDGHQALAAREGGDRAAQALARPEPTHRFSP